MNLLNKRALGISAALVGIAAAGVATELVGRRRRSRRMDAGEDVPFGSLHSEPRPFVASDGVRLHVEVDEADDPTSAVTVIFAHGWVLDLDSWHYQRAALRGDVRMVFYDQRSHGRSGRATRNGSTFEQLGRDLRDVIEQTTPEGPVILVGHSMGGMTIMSLAEHFPDFVRERVVGVLLCGTSAGGLLPAGTPLRTAANRLERVGFAITPFLALGRRIGTNRSSRRLIVGPDSPDRYVDMTTQMLRRARTHVLLDFLPNFGGLDAYEALATLPGKSTVVVSGTDDQLTPHKHSIRIVDRLPGARLVVADGAGHMVQLERHDLVTATLDDLIDQVTDERETA